MYVYMCIYICVCVYMCVFICVYVCIYYCVYMYVCVCYLETVNCYLIISLYFNSDLSCLLLIPHISSPVCISCFSTDFSWISNCVTFSHDIYGRRETEGHPLACWVVGLLLCSSHRREWTPAEGLLPGEEADDITEVSTNSQISQTLKMLLPIQNFFLSFVSSL